MPFNRIFFAKILQYACRRTFQFGFYKMHNQSGVPLQFVWKMKPTVYPFIETYQELPI